MTATPQSARCAVYVRISDDREGSGLGVARQEADCRRRAEALGWDIVAMYSDNDISAYSGKNRPNYKQLLESITDGRVEALICWHTDRLHRNVRELLDFLDVIKDRDRKHSGAPFRIETVQAGRLDLGTPNGRAMAITFGAWAEQESSHKAQRIQGKHLELAKSGKSTGGGFRPYGYRRIYDRAERPRRLVREEIIPEEAEIIRECARRVLAGEKLSGICKDLNTRGVPTSSVGIWTAKQVHSLAEVGRNELADEVRRRLTEGEAAVAISHDFQERDLPTFSDARWSTSTLARVLSSARIAGLREHRPRSRHETKRVTVGEIMGEGQWKAIITPAESARLRILLTDPARRTSPGPTGTYLLTGLIYCDLCKHRMTGRLKSGGLKSGGRRTYSCDDQPGRPGCGGVTIRAEYTNAVIAALAAEFLTSPDMRSALQNKPPGPGEDEVLAEISACEQDLADLAADHGAGTISRMEWMSARKPLQARIEAAQASLGRVDVSRVLEGLPEDLEGMEAFLLNDELEASRRRAVLALALERVWVRPAIVRGSKTFNPARLDPLWRF